MKRLEIQTIEISGFASALMALRLPYKKESRSIVNNVINCSSENELSISTRINFDDGDLNLMSTLLLRGDEHAKILRSINVYATITAPRWWWQEMLTYTVGVTHLGGESIMKNECKGLYGENLEAAKDLILDGMRQNRIVVFTYQTLRRIYYQRKTVQMPTWDIFCSWIESLPFSKELILINK